MNGLGKHRAALPPEKVAIFAELLYFFQIFYVLAPPSVKLSLLFLYRRIFEHSRFLRLVYGVVGLIVVWAIIMTFLSIFNCKPISAFWTTKGTCLDFRQFAIGYAIVNIITDFAVWLMPIPSVWKIQLPQAQKIALSLIFAIGLLYVSLPLPYKPGSKWNWQTSRALTGSIPNIYSDCAAAIARLILSMLVLGEYDTTWLYAKGYMWSIIEVSTGIVCTCLPTMRIFLKAAFGGRFARLFGLSSGKARQQHPSTTPWSRTDECYNETGETRIIKLSSSGHRTELTDSNSHDPEWDAMSQRILVTNEVNIEMQPVKKTAVMKI